jgi:hypothetical protein
MTTRRFPRHNLKITRARSAFGFLRDSKESTALQHFNLPL